MNFFISDTFTDSLTRLPAQEQKAVKTTAFDLQVNPAHPGLKLHRLERARDKNFWSVRAGSDIRIIVHRTASSFVLCYADHHDKAYGWAQRRRLERHPATGAAQLVEIHETVEEIVVAGYADGGPVLDASAPLRNCTDDEMLSWGVPADWIKPLRAADDERLLAIAERLPAEAAEAVLEVATGGSPRPVAPAAPESDPFEHPEAQQRFRMVTGIEELERALDYPWEKWTVFLHPQQRSIVEQHWSGPARVTGSAGTGKTVVALHRAVFLARHNDSARVLLTTISEPLADALRIKLRRLVGNEPRIAERIDVAAIDQVVTRLAAGAADRLTPEGKALEILGELYQAADAPSFSLSFATAEWTHIVDLHNLTSWESYQEIPRLGRKTRLPESRRRELWALFEQLRTELVARRLVTMSQRCHAVAATLRGGIGGPYTHVVVDEAQDVAPAQLVFLSALAGSEPDALFCAGDTGQRIFRQPFSWVRLGVDVRGRSRVLRVNYRTSHQIRRCADRLLDAAISDPDGTTDRRDDTVSVFNGPVPRVQLFEHQTDETAAVADWVASLVRDGAAGDSVAVIVRSESQMERAREAAVSGAVAITMHEAKGLEFRAVAVMACDDEVIPAQTRIESVGDEADLDEVYATERHLLYVACTRARDHLLVTAVAPGSEFLDDLQGR
ncbi:MAG: DNA helicase [Spirochaetaceae bacterium]|nr:MAG: DNA helicase [Spirochaetaceae bacterium]